jgi:hypothetical protein
MPPTMTEADGRSKKALLFAMILVAIAGGGGWFALTRKAAAPATLLAAPVSRTEPKPATGTSVAMPSAGPRTPLAAAPAAARLPDSATTRTAAKEKPAIARDRTPNLDVDLATPTIPASVDVDAVTRGIEQSTKAKVDSAQKPRIDVKPIFKKP